MSMNIPPAFVEAVQAAVERLSRPGIEGWGLRICEDMAAAGELVEVSERIGCTSETCAHVSHDPAAPMCRWWPRGGQLVELGSDEEPGEVLVRYYAHLDGDTTRYIVVGSRGLTTPRLSTLNRCQIGCWPGWLKGPRCNAAASCPAAQGTGKMKEAS